MMHLWIQRGIYEAIHEAAAPGLLDECQKLKGCETGKCNRLNDCYISCWQEVIVYNIKSFTFCCRAIGVAGFDQ